jgi:hypothetical protein
MGLPEGDDDALLDDAEGDDDALLDDEKTIKFS